ncbi:CHRD domain-containing protein [Pseudonocardia abyssalis]|uniref:CHRD domain-containing protein n=1 Tax=Pseudonocardia abyssalis TaxID=2792008 RepID=A0ABS6UTQ5_9PSEU|nr:CHRD domain-containing protein [Pseudonocardia abyssalis]MBW0115347.1 CHRD domain-containing protein [Pseudonocardia abyssalis]MBW0135639.1 CHRD domain-containing protein [Pseudonocardia abyssalis]
MRPTVRRIAILSAITTASVALSAGVASAQDAEVPEPSTFTSMFTAMATPDMVINNDGVATPGEEGATGTFNYRINSDDEIICYDITLNGVTPPYMSPARTATHIHEAEAGAAGPPRIAFPNPEDDGSGTLRSEGCLQGPFTTGVAPEGTDTGEGFTLDQIEADPSAFFTDTHTANFTAGAVRGQLTSVPMGGVATGAGGTAGENRAPVALGAAALVGIAGVGTVVARRRAQD